MDPIVEIPALNLNPGERRSEEKDSSSGSVTVTSGLMATKEEKNLIRDEDFDYKSRTKRHTERENEISNADQVRGDGSAPPEGSPSPRKTLERSPPRAEGPPNGPPNIPPTCKRDSGGMNEKSSSRRNPVEELKKQNCQLMEALIKFQKAHASEKKRFHEILFGIDKALSSLPVRLERIRVKNQRNLSIINSSRFNSGDGEEDASGMSAGSSSSEDSASSSQTSSCYLSARMTCLLKKMDQVNEIVANIQRGGSSPIELLVDSELYAISLLKKEIKSTKKRIEENRTDTETVTSCNESNPLTEDSSSKANNSFSNELNKASNFKIFENHMILQEEALNLLTRKIKETEEALSKELEAKEALKRENEAMAKEIFKLKFGREEPTKEKPQKTDKSKPEPEAQPTRPFRLIKELKAKLEEKEKSLLSWKSKCSRLESVNSNKGILLESEKKKTAQLETTLKNMKAHNKSIVSQLSSLQFLNEQLRDQSEILKHQVEILARERLQNQLNASPGSETELRKLENRLQEMRTNHEKEIEEIWSKLKKSQNRSEELCKSIKELLSIVNNFSMEKDIKSMRNPSYDRIREILQISSSELQLLFSTYAKNSTEKELGNLYEEFSSIVNGESGEFSETLSVWLFDVITEKLLASDVSNDIVNNNTNNNN